MYPVAGFSLSQCNERGPRTLHRFGYDDYISNPSAGARSRKRSSDSSFPRDNRGYAGGADIRYFSIFQLRSLRVVKVPSTRETDLNILFEDCLPARNACAALRACKHVMSIRVNPRF
jgi:hypothetical protein